MELLNMVDTTVCTPQPTYVIIEQVHPPSNIPIFKNQGPGVYQLYRRVLQVCDVQDVFFDGNAISGTPSTWQYIQEFLRQGEQITSRPNGRKQLLLAYAGFKNIVKALPKIDNVIPNTLSKDYDWGTPPTPFVLGQDPIPSVGLFGNASAQFVTFGGKPPATAVGIYKSIIEKLDLPLATDRDRAIKQLIQPEPSR